MYACSLLLYVNYIFWENHLIIVSITKRMQHSLYIVGLHIFKDLKYHAFIENCIGKNFEQEVKVYKLLKAIKVLISIILLQHT